MIPERYQKNIGEIGEEGQKKLLNSHVTIVGAGGLGGVLFENLLRAGVG
ncbi:MAG TPA: ThiF family adenylyltransferase, partial [bacterium]|nr:ThiF family adenylyltransferase [bacterium]